eukprot:SAG31_NODE_1855_length_7064_cov_49.836324_3_plen_43_part_00
MVGAFSWGDDGRASDVVDVAPSIYWNAETRDTSLLHARAMIV